MGPVRQNPIQRTVSLFICVCIALCTILHRTDLRVFPLTLQTVTTAPMMSIWGTGVVVREMSEENYRYQFLHAARANILNNAKLSTLFVFLLWQYHSYNTLLALNNVFLILWFLCILVDKLIYLWNLVPGAPFAEPYSVYMYVAMPNGKVREFHVVWKVVTL